MSDNQDQVQENTSEVQENTTDQELVALRQQADTMGIQYHPSIGVDKLRTKIKERLEEKNEISSGTVLSEKQLEINEAKIAQKQRMLRQRQGEKLVRVIVTNMNPNKKDWEGEIFAAANNLREHKRFIPFGTETHVPRMILDQLKERKFNSYYTQTGERGRKFRRARQVAEFAIQELSPLTETELKDLGEQQIVNRSIDK